MGTRYAEIADLLALAMLGNLIPDVSDADKEKALDSASDEASGYLRAVYVLPLTAWGNDLRQHVTNIAAYRLISREGYNPTAGSDAVIRLNYEDAIRWLKEVAAGRVVPEVTDSSPPPPIIGDPTSSARGTGPMVVQAQQTAGGVIVVSPPSPRWSPYG